MCVCACVCVCVCVCECIWCIYPGVYITHFKLSEKEKKIRTVFDLAGRLPMLSFRLLNTIYCYVTLRVCSESLMFIQMTFTCMFVMKVCTSVVFIGFCS